MVIYVNNNPYKFCAKMGPVVCKRRSMRLEKPLFNLKDTGRENAWEGLAPAGKKPKTTFTYGFGVTIITK